MIKKTIKYVDFNGVERTEECYFNLTKAEISELELSIDGGYSNMLTTVAESGDNNKILQAFKDMIRMSYGVKSEDGRRFMKTDSMFEEFAQTEAYSELFMSLISDAEAGEEFINGIMPMASK